MPESDNAARNNPLRAANILRAVCIALVFFYALRLVGIASSVLLAGFLGILFGLNLSRLADILERWKIPRAVTAAGVVVILFALVGVGIKLLTPTLRDQGRSIRTQIPLAVDNIEARLRSIGVVIPMPPPTAADSAKRDSARADSVRAGTASTDAAVTQGETGEGASDPTGALRAQLIRRVGSLGHVAVSFMSSASSALAGLFVVIFIAVFYAIEPNTYRRGFLHLVPHQRHARIGETMTQTGTVLRQWLVAQFLAMLCVGVLSTIAYFIIGLKAAIALGIVAGLCEFVPFVGPIAAAIPALGMALADSPEKALYVVIATVVIQQSEELLIVPLLMKQNLTLPPLLTILAQGAMGLAFGIIGLLVAVPLLAAVMVPVKMLYVEDVVGDDMHLDDEAETPKTRKSG